MKISEKIVYVVDDDAVHLSMMRFMLRRIGFIHIETFTDVESAFNQIQYEKPNLIISDWNMDPIDGITFLQEIRQTTGLENVPFIMVTANTSEDYWRRAIESGATEFLYKPFLFDLFREAVLISLDIVDKQSKLKGIANQHEQLKLFKN